MVDVFGVIAPSRKVFPPGKAAQAEPWLVRNGKNDPSPAHPIQFHQRAARILKMFQNLQAKDDVGAPVLQGEVVDVAMNDGANRKTSFCISRTVGIDFQPKAGCLPMGPTRQGLPLTAPGIQHDDIARWGTYHCKHSTIKSLDETADHRIGGLELPEVGGLRPGGVLGLAHEGFIRSP